MQGIIPQIPTSQIPPPKLRAFVEVVYGQLVIQPIAESDEQAAQILAAVRFAAKDLAER